MQASKEKRAYRRRQERRFPQHACELPEHPDRVYPVLPPNASRWLRTRRWLQKQVVAWRWVRPLRLLRPSTCALEAEQARQTHLRYWWVLHPFSRAFLAWQLVVIVSVSLTNFLIPFIDCLKNPYLFLGPWMDKSGPIPAFMDDDLPATKAYVATVASVWWYVKRAQYTCDAVFGLHMLVMFVAGYYDLATKEVVLAPSRIAARYLRTWFVLDLLSLVDYQKVLLEVVAQGLLDLNEVDHSHLMYLLRLWIVFFTFQVVRLHYLFSYTRDWCHVANLRPIARRAILFVILFAGFLLWATAYSMQIPMLIQRWPLLADRGGDSWLMDAELGFFDVGQPHLLWRQLLLAVNRVVGVASAHVPHFSADTPHMTLEDTVLLLVIMWISTGFKIVLFGLILEYAESKNSAEVELEKVRKQVRHYLRDQQLPVHVREKVLALYNHRFEGRYFKERAIIAHLPAAIRTAVRLASSRQLVSGSPLFRNVPKALVNKIVSSLQEELFLPNDVVYASGDPARNLYFLAQGTVAVFLATGEEVGHLGDHASFGEMGLMLPEHRRRHLESVVALELSHAFLLERRAFERLVRPLPRVYNRIRAAAMLRAAEVSQMEWAGADADLSFDSVRSASVASGSDPRLRRPRDAASPAFTLSNK